MSRFQTLKQDLTQAIKAAYGNEIKIRYGQPLTPITTGAYVIVRLAVSRAKEGRQVIEEYAIDIEAQFLLSDLGNDTDIELFERGDLLAQEIAPHTDDPDELADIARPVFGSIWTQPTVLAITPLDQVGSDLTRGVRLDATVTTTVFQ